MSKEACSNSNVQRHRKFSRGNGAKTLKPMFGQELLLELATAGANVGSSMSIAGQVDRSPVEWMNIFARLIRITDH